MVVKYDGALCEQYVLEMLHRLTQEEFVRVWFVFSFGEDGISWIDDGTAYFLNSWKDMSCWNKQAVLFLMATHITAIAHQVAMTMASRARVEEPL